jgi:hypothetical protein
MQPSEIPSGGPAPAVLSTLEELLESADRCLEEGRRVEEAWKQAELLTRDHLIAVLARTGDALVQCEATRVRIERELEALRAGQRYQLHDNLSCAPTWLSERA